MSKTLSSQLKSLNYSFNLVSGLDTPSIKAGYSEYQGLVFFLDTFVNFSIMPSMVQKMQEMQDFAHINGYADNAWTVVTGLTEAIYDFETADPFSGWTRPESFTD